MLDKLTAGDFKPLLHQQLQMRLGEGQTQPAELTEVNEVKVRPEELHLRERKAPFSLIFRTDSARQLAQGTYRIEFPKLGGLDIFLVPVGRNEQYCYYEAVFN